MIYGSIHGTVWSMEYGVRSTISIHGRVRCACPYPFAVARPSALHHRPFLPLFSSLFSFSSTLESFLLYHHVSTIPHHPVYILCFTRAQLMPPPDSHQSNHPIHLDAQPIHLVDHIRQFNHISTGLFRCWSARFG